METGNRVSTGSLIRVARPAMGSPFAIYAGGEDVDALERLAYAALDRVDWLEQQLSHYLPDSEISRLNARAYKETVAVTPNLFALLLRLRQLSAETEGAFDSTTGKLVRIWGFFRRGQSHAVAAEPPDTETLAAVTQQIGWRHIELNEKARTVRFLTPQVELHLGAVGKGYIVQCAADYLRSEGVACALLHSGQSSIVAVGAPPESEGWTIGIPDPSEEALTSPPSLTARERGAGGVRAIVKLRDAALSTSGGAEQSVTMQGTRYAHLFDPRTGFPVNGPAAVTVLSPDAADGDALSTAFFVQGAEWTRAFCRSHPDIGALFVIGDAASAPRTVRIGRPFE
jgi:thiamine biosynthesis lipoprotein